MLTFYSHATSVEAVLDHVEHQLIWAFDDALTHLAQQWVALDGLAARVRKQSYTCAAA
jgi:hypothetical protein